MLTLGEIWRGWPADLQDALILVALILPGLLVGLVCVRGFAPGVLLRGLIRRHFGVSLTFVLLIAASVALGTGLIAQERGLRRGTARAADKFDLIVAAPGSEVTVMLAAVYLQPSDMALLDGPTFAAIASNPRVSMAAPIAFGDSWHESPIVGTIPAFVQHLAGTALSEGRSFLAEGEAIAGALVPLEIGDTFSPAHGHGDGADAHAHGDFTYQVVGRLPATGSPWDRALLVPVESVWAVHGLANGHGPGWDGTLGAAFDPAYFPGTPAVLVGADALWAHYALRSELTTDTTMAFFPGAVLARLLALMGDVRQVMQAMAVLTQVLVAAGVLAGLVILMRLLARRMALLRALGAPRRFVFALVWSFAAVLIGTGSVLGLALGLLSSRVLSAMVTARTDILVQAGLGWPEFQLVAGFFSVGVVLALIPAGLTMVRAPVDDLRAG